MSTHKHLFGLILLTLVAGCTSEWDPERAAAADTARAAAQSGPAMSRGRTATAFAALPDRGELLAYDPRRATRHRGAYTSYPVNLSEAHAFHAAHEGGELVVNAPNGQLLRLRYERHVEHSDGNWTWIGRNAEGADAVFTFGEKAVFGTIPYAGEEPLRVTTMSGSAWLVATDRSKLPADADLATARAGKPDYLVPPDLPASSALPVSSSMASTQDVSAKAVSNTIDLVLGYTTGYAAQLGGASQAASRLNFMVEVANIALANSQISRRFRLMQVVRVDYPDATDNAEALEQLTGYSIDSGSEIPVPAGLEPLREAREEFGGDLVALVRAFRIPENNGCGIAWLIGGGQTPVTTADAAFGYSVVSDGSVEEGNVQYRCRDETLVRELGHNLGQANNEEDSLQAGAHAYSYGYRESSDTGFYTVMAYRLANSRQVAILHFANPAVEVNGRPTGVVDVSDNVRSMNQTMPVVAAFRASQVTGFVRNDIDGDGRSDLLLRFASGSENKFGYWVLDNGALQRTWSVVTNGVYQIAATGDFNGDGRVDIVWTSAQRDLKLWLGNGTSFSNSQSIGSLPVGWSVVGAGDINDDGKSDLLLRYIAGSSGKFGYWIMNGANVVRTWSTSASPAYQIAATGDFDADGHLDIAWTSARRDVKIWLGNGTSFAASEHAGTYDVGWAVIGAGDIDGNGKSDLLLRYIAGSSGKLGYWIMNGGDRQTTRSFPASPAYSVAATGDYNGDGRIDIAWTSARRDVKIWFGTGTAFTDSKSVGVYSPGWSVLDPGR